MTALLAAAFDLSVARAQGYLFRRDGLELVTASVATTGFLAASALLLLHWLARMECLPTLLRRAPRTCVLLAAAWPVLFKRAYLLESPHQLAPDLGLVLMLASLCAFEARWSAAPGIRLAGVTIAVSAIAMAWAITPRLPGVAELKPVATHGSPSSSEQPNLILIVLDTMKADHLSLYGYARAVSPWLDAFASRASVFEQAISSSSWTLPAHATLFTGLFPRTHGADLAEADVTALARLREPMAGLPPARPLAQEARTLAEVARDAGLETAAICANPTWLHRSFGLAQGFETYVDVGGVSTRFEPAGLWFASRAYRPLRWRANANGRRALLAAEVSALASQWIEPRRDRRFLLFLNYMEAHTPHIPYSSYRDLFPHAWPPGDVDAVAIRERSRGILPRERRALVDSYDADVRYLDDQLRLLFEKLESWGLLERSLVVIVGDHGESFGEHNDLWHGNGVYQAEVRVPLILRLPGQRVGRRIDRVVHLVDVMPTILEAMGLSAPADLQGESLWSERRRYPPVAYTGRFPDKAERHPRFFDLTQTALYRDPWKLIRRSNGEVELYNIRDDPGEVSDLGPFRAELVDALSDELLKFESEVRPRFGSQVAPLDPDLIERLRALGYAE